ncbi:cytochrome b/b6 domain-containing protein [Streptomyces purpurascens]|uniref:cytochrome b/b6 domain-containing protein n=1 Tax=Streptomyces purpurascens TaxID=1924 RepID=UPI001679E696|nr:cytochrome b/b6 domain-containing protein [Streptomyces purpurascens]MCE7045207.1 cytochrome b/b6 domain-containing protein [Streptomyces purpurascens]GHA11951.1 membrane protein [Streptomyces purpurascens]
MNPYDSTADDSFAEFLNFGAGVLSLVCLSCSVIWGLVAQDRVLLDTRRRILAQAVHRTTAVASIVFLLVHIGVKLALEHTSWIAAVIPFGLLLTKDEAGLGRSVLIGLGTVASMLMIFVGVTGVLRNRFASPAPVAARWRAMHMLAYPAWCAALVHGLYAGRAAKPIFVILYCLSLAGVAGALALRAAPRPVKRKIADKFASLIGPGEPSARRDLEESRARATGGSTLPGYESRDAPRRAAASPSGPLYEKAERPAAREPANGFAAAYRAVSGPPPGQQAFAPGPSTRTELPLDMQPTQNMPLVDGPSSTSGNWPIPSPPPVGEAPPSAYDPLQDTGFNIPPYDPLQDTGQSIPAYGNPGAAGYGSSDVYDTGESNAAFDTYYPNDTYNSGPATETLPGASYDFDAPGSGEPWNTPSGGFK